MKKFILGFIIGSLIFTTIPVLAVTMLGKAVDTIYPVIIDGERVSKDAIVIEGTSYLPVRVVAETVGYNVYFKGGEILLNKKIEPKFGSKGAFYYKSDWFDIGKRNNNPWDKSTKPELSLFFELDGELYVPYHIFNKYAKLENAGIIISLPGKTECKINYMKGNEKYIPGCQSFVEIGITFVKASELGVKAVIKGNEVWIEQN